MKKVIAYLLITIFAAATASAEEKQPWWKLGLGGKDVVAQEEVVPPSQRMKEGAPQRQRAQMSDAQRAEMKANQEIIHQLAEAARAETDPAKKAVLVDQLRAKLTEGAQKMQAEFRKRLQTAEGEVSKMKERLAEAEKNMDKRVEEHLQKLLAGEKMERLGGKHLGKKGPQVPVE